MTIGEVQCDFGSAESTVEVGIEFGLGRLPVPLHLRIALVETLDELDDLSPLSHLYLLALVGIRFAEEVIETLHLRLLRGL